MISTAPDSRSMNRSSTAREAAPSSAALSGTASSQLHQPRLPRTSVQTEAVLGSWCRMPEETTAPLKRESRFEARYQRQVKNPVNRQETSKSGWSEDSGQNSTATSIRIGKIVSTMVPINSSLSANISGQY
ncbi:hypothetical protein MRX96_032953 [Rhipicephalus microplus]